MVYCYKCKQCGLKYEHTALLADGNICEMECGGLIVRDYKAESVGVNVSNLR